MVLKNLNTEQKLKGKEVYVDIQEKTIEDQYFCAVWSPVMKPGCFIDTETKQQIMQWKSTHSPRPKKARCENPKSRK